MYKHDSNARLRVEESKVLLNLDHPEFNAERGELYEQIKWEVEAHDDLPPGGASQLKARHKLAVRVRADQPFSAAARTYLRFFRDRDWVEQLRRDTED